jgi:hypothetical protein
MTEQGFTNESMYRNATFNDVDRSYSTMYGNKLYYVFISAAPRDGVFHTRSGSYTVPAGQGTTVFGFVSIARVQAGFGNILDDIVFASGSDLAPTQTATYTGDSSITATTKAGYAYALAEVRGSNVNELAGLSAYYDADAAGAGEAVPISPTANLGSGGWYTTNSNTGTGGTAFATGATITFRGLIPGKTYRVIGIPIAAINPGLSTNESAGAVLDSDYYSDIKLTPVAGGTTVSLPAYRSELYEENGATKVRLTLINTNAGVDYALLASDVSGTAPLTTGPALPTTAWKTGSGGELAFRQLEPDTVYYLVARPAGYSEIDYALAAYDDTGGLAALKVRTPALSAVDISASAVRREEATVITIAPETTRPGYTYAVADPLSGAILQSLAYSGNTLVFSNLSSSRTYQVVASLDGGESYLAGVRVYPYVSTPLNIDYANAAIGAGSNGGGSIVGRTEYRLVATDSTASWLLGDSERWVRATGSERIELEDASLVAAGTLGGQTGSMSVFDALEALGLGGEGTAATLTYRTAPDAGYSGPEVRPISSLLLPARPVAPLRIPTFL